MNFNWRAAIIAFVVTSVIFIIDRNFVNVPDLSLAGITIGGLIAGYMVEGYLEGILNGAFPVSLAKTAIDVLLISDMSSVLIVGLFPSVFVISLIGPIIGVTIKKIKNKSLKYSNKFNNSNKAVMDRTVTDSTYTEKLISKFKKINIWEVIFIGIVIIISLIGILELFMFFLVVLMF